MKMSTERQKKLITKPETVAGNIPHAHAFFNVSGRHFIAKANDKLQSRKKPVITKNWKATTNNCLYLGYLFDISDVLGVFSIWTNNLCASSNLDSANLSPLYLNS